MSGTLPSAVVAGGVDPGWRYWLSTRPGSTPPATIREVVRWVAILGTLLSLTATCAAADPIVIGSKKFTESYVLAEIAKRLLKDNGVAAEHRQGMGGTIILWQALRGSQIDAYPEYTGTITQEILKRNDNMTFE